MTEAGWLKCTSPKRMLDFLEGKVSDRKLWLFALACCRPVWPRLKDDRSRRAVEVAERYADGEATEKELRRAEREHWKFSEYQTGTADVLAWHAAYSIWRNSLAWPVFLKLVAQQGVSPAAQVGLLRDLFGNPFRPAALDSGWLAWQGGTVPKLAASIYEERQLPSGHLDPHRLAVLADALEEAGCSDPAILSHLRGPGVHARGCWAVDLLLGKA